MITRPLSLWWTMLMPMMALLLHASYYYPFFVDDAFISLRYADRLLAGHGLTWNDGERVEGYSNLLWILLTAALGWLGFDLVAAGRIVCLLAALSTFGALRYYQMHILPRCSAALMLANLALALSAPVAIWSLGGLEATLSMALLAWAYALAMPLLQQSDHKRAALVGVLLGLVCITRPEGAFFTMALTAALFLCTMERRGRLLASIALLCAIPFAFFSAQVGFRLWYYGYPMPNTYYAKVALGTPARLLNGSMYVIKALASFLPLLLIVLLKIEQLRKPLYSQSARRVICLALIASSWLIMLTVAGGDIFAGYRHILPALPALLLMAMEAFAIAYDHGTQRGNHIFFGYLLACFFWLQCVFDENRDAKDEKWEWQAAELGRFLGREYEGKDMLIAASNTGAIPYYSKLPTLDMYGINDGYLAHHRGRIFGQGFQGHELFNSDYVLSRKPDMVIFFTGVAKGVYGSDLFERTEFQEQYEKRIIPLPSYDAVVWMRKSRD